MDWEFYPFSSLDDPCLRHWQELNERVTGAHPGLDGQYMGLLLKHFGTGDERIAIGMVNGRAVAGAIIAPLDRWRWSLFLPGQGCLGPLLLDSECAVAEIMRSLIHSIPGTCLMLRMPRLDLKFQPVFVEALKHRFDTDVYGETFLIDLDGNFEEYWQQRPKRLKQTIRKKLRDAARAGHDVQLRIRDDVDAVRQAVRIHGALESKGWKGRAGSAIDFDGPQGAFYSDLLASFASRNTAISAQLYFDEDLVASLLNVGSGKILIILKTTYNEDFKSYSPGRLLDYLFLEDRMSTSVLPKYEAYTRASPHDLSWATAMRTIYDVDLYRATWLRRLMTLIRGAWSPIRRLTSREAP